MADEDEDQPAIQQKPLELMALVMMDAPGDDIFVGSIDEDNISIRYVQRKSPSVPYRCLDAKVVLFVQICALGSRQVDHANS